METQVLDSLAVYLADISKYPLLPVERELELFRQMWAGDVSARELLIASNLRLVAYIARKKAKGVSLEELIAEGNCGLIRAVDKFDASHGCRLSTYATLWIRQFMDRYIADRHIIHVPDMYSRAYAQDLVNPKLKELARKARRMKRIEPGYQTDDSITEFIDKVSDVPAKKPSEQWEVNFDALVKALPDNYRVVIEYRFKMGMTLREIATILELSKERIRQIQKAAINKLRDLRRAE